MHLPEVNLTHVDRLTDSTGMIQHAVYGLPNRREGYCIDDNARALLLAVLACRNNKHNETALRLLPVYLGFVHYMQTENGLFRNFMLYNKVCPEEHGSEDSFGRTVMALGYLVKEGPTRPYIKIGEEIFMRAYPQISSLTSLRGIANALIGLSLFVQFNYPDDLKREQVAALADKMMNMYAANCTPDWQWFEPILTYDNAIMPLALLHAYELTGNEACLSVALESMHFLESKVFHEGILRPVGNKGWWEKGQKQGARFDQQGIDVMAMVLYYEQAWKVTRDEQYLTRLYQCFQWFHGANDLEMALYDPENGGCADGLQAEGINQNQGAESTLAYWISHLTTEAIISASK